MELVKCVNLCKNYDTKQALKNINISIPSGKIIGLLGTNGSGKTTLIKMINGLLQPSSGELLVKGNPIGIESKKIISYLPEKTYLPSDKKSYEIINYFKDFYQDFNENKAYELLKTLQISPNDPLKELSKGTKEKVQLILVMSREADLYILDEPIGGVDPLARDVILDLILKNFNPTASILISTHLIADIEKILDEVIFINKGEIILTANADELRNKHQTSIENVFKEVFKKC